MDIASFEALALPELQVGCFLLSLKCFRGIIFNVSDSIIVPERREAGKGTFYMLKPS